jgi:hypothetical protein
MILEPNVAHKGGKDIYSHYRAAPMLLLLIMEPCSVSHNVDKDHYLAAPMLLIV